MYVCLFLLTILSNGFLSSWCGCSRLLCRRLAISRGHRAREPIRISFHLGVSAVIKFRVVRSKAPRIGGDVVLAAPSYHYKPMHLNHSSPRRLSASLRRLLPASSPFSSCFASSHLFVLPASFPFSLVLSFGDHSTRFTSPSLRLQPYYVGLD